jgi:nucleotide-binding universal stress UspA family protein
MFKRILTPLDGSALAEVVLPHVISLAKAYDAQVILARVLERRPEASARPVDPLEWTMHRAEAEAYLNDVDARLQETGLPPAVTVLLDGEPAQCIVEYIHTHEVELVVLSSHGKTGLSRWNVSSVVRKVVQRANRSTMIVPAYRAAEFEALSGARYRRLLVPLDGSQRAEFALTTAQTLAHYHEARLLLGHVVGRPGLPYQASPSDEDQALIERLVERLTEVSSEYLEHLRARLSVDFKPCLRVNDDIAATLHELVEAEEVDLVVLCAHGYSGKTKWPFGSVTTSFIEYGTRPLLMMQDLGPDEVEPTGAERAAVESKGH